MRDTLNEENGRKLNLSISNIIPILTASLGTALDSKVEDLIQFVRADVFRNNIIDQIISSLNINDKQEENAIRILYSVEEKDRRIEH